MDNKELLEVYNEKGIKTGEIVERGNLPKTGYILAAGVIIENSKNEYLIQKTSKEKGSEFALTGGHVRKGESVLDCIIREVKEEIGLTLEKDELKLLGTEKHPDIPLIFNFYYAKKDIDINMLKLQNDEVEYVTFMNKETMIKYINNNEFRKTTVTTLNKFIF